MNQPGRFGPFLLFQATGSSVYRSCYRAGIASGRAIERIVRLEVYDQPGFDPSELLIQLEASAELQSKLQDPHIASGAGIGHVEAVPWVAYDFELGTTLAEFLVAARERSFPVPLDQALFIAERVALALAAAYRLESAGGGIHHSFLTPDAVLLSNVGEVKVCGFEVGLALRDRLAGEPYCAPYLSPEARAGQAPRTQDDVFSLGSLLFELLTGNALALESTDLDAAIVLATGEPAPRSLVALLRGSLAPLPERIPNVEEWQRSVGKLILDGDYNPTTFNLAFMMHTVLREPLERGVERLEREKRFVLPPVEESVAASAAAEVSSDPGAPARGSGEQGPTPTSGTGTRRPTETWNQPPVPSPTDRSPFWAGFSISVVAASALLGALMFLGSGPKSAPARTAVRLEPTREPAAASQPASQNSVRPAAALTAAPTLVRTEVVEGQLENPVDSFELERIVAERAAEIERSLAAEYEQKLEDLRREMIAKSEPDTRDREGVEGPATGTSTASREPGAQRPTADEEPISSPPAPKVRLDAAASPTHDEVDERLKRPEHGEPGDPIRGVPQASSLPPPAAKARHAPDSTAATRPLPGPVKLPAAEVGHNAGADPPPPVETPPRLLRLSPPAYPPAARRFGLSATARVNVVISAEGRVRDAEILGPVLGSGFDRAAIAAVHRSKWKPATRNGEPVESTSVVTLEFRP